MRLFRISLPVIVLLCSCLNAVATEEIDEFGDEQATFVRWNDCQAYRDRLKFGNEGGRTWLRNRVDARVANVDQCRGDVVAVVEERLGPSLVEPDEAAVTGKFCPPGDEVEDQRNELRFRRRDNFHPVDAGHWYAITFRLAGAGGDVIPDCGSARWINAQWKYDTSKAASAAREDEFLNGSPFLAQRFDNGVLHVTVEDGFCRCLIAKGPGDPDQVAARLAPLTAPVKLTEVKPLRCADDMGMCRPPHLKLLAAEPDALEALPNPKDDWVTMMYFVQADAGQGTRFDVYANGKFIVRAIGAVSAGAERFDRVKFKFGHYRDRFASQADLFVDRICVSQDAKKCDEKLKVVP